MKKRPYSEYTSRTTHTYTFLSAISNAYISVMKHLAFTVLTYCLSAGLSGFVSAQTLSGEDAKKQTWNEANQEILQEQQAEIELARANHNRVGAIAPPNYPKFISYPTSHKKPPYIDNEDKELARLIYELRLQHWHFIFDQETFKRKYGPLPTTLPGGLTPREYAQNTPTSAFSEDLERHIESGK